MIDHSVMENLHHFDDDYTRAGGSVEFLGLDQLKQVRLIRLRPESVVKRPNLRTRSFFAANGE